jgi:hypothetical protein
MVLFAALLAAVPFHAALAATAAPDLRTAGSFAVLAGTAVTCTNSTVIGDVGIAATGAVVTRINCTINGALHEGDTVAKNAYIDFLSAYNALAHKQCDYTLSGDLGSVTLTQPGVYCVDAASTMTGGTLTLIGSSTDIWIFKIGISGTGALTGTNFDVVMEGGSPCNVYWWVAEAATMTDSNFVGTILAGTSITVKRGTFNGDALAKVAVTLTGPEGEQPIILTGCVQAGHTTGTGCNQGVGNGPEGCDPGNSNQGDPSRSNDEPAGTAPGNPGRKGGNGK